MGNHSAILFCLLLTVERLVKIGVPVALVLVLEIVKGVAEDVTVVKVNVLALA